MSSDGVRARGVPLIEKPCQPDAVFAEHARLHRAARGRRSGRALVRELLDDERADGRIPRAGAPRRSSSRRRAARSTAACRRRRSTA